MTERLTYQEAKSQLDSHLANYAKLDRQMSILQKQTSELRKQQNQERDRIDLLAKALRLDGQRVSCQRNTFQLDYIAPRVALSQKLLRESLTGFFQDKLRVARAENLVDQYLAYLENSKEQLGGERKKNLKIKYS